ncbi:hypothetical protein VNO77_32526 [Canavalia gladiata]|uniref:Uncharacterized protein n=1 Tax=Canavalia gladiata TaxID=3824 RepID=A0AAN9KTH5_CANGL
MPCDVYCLLNWIFTVEVTSAIASPLPPPPASFVLFGRFTGFQRLRMPDWLLYVCDSCIYAANYCICIRCLIVNGRRYASFSVAFYLHPLSFGKTRQVIQASISDLNKIAKLLLLFDLPCLPEFRLLFRVENLKGLDLLVYG